VVYGSYYAARDTVRFQAEVADAQSDVLLQSLAPVNGPRSDPLTVLEDLRQHVMGALASHVDPRLALRATGSMPPPSYEAYKVYTEAYEAFWRNLREAEQLAYRAMELDSTWGPARVLAATVHMNLGEYKVADSLAQMVDDVPGRLGPLDRVWLDWLRAHVAHDRQAAYRASRRWVEMSPSHQMRCQVGHEALALNRPNEAIERIGSADLYGAEMQGMWWYVRSLTAAHHMLGDHERELAEARRAREHYPDHMGVLDLEVRALAAMGRAEEVSALWEERPNLAPRSGASHTESMFQTALEFRAHGFHEAYRQTVDAVLDRYDSRPADQQEGLRYSRAVMLYHAERFEDAFELFEELVAQWPDSLDEIRWLGVTAAAVGYRDSALAMMERVGDLDLPYRRHEKAGSQAAIAAALGDRELAMQYLRQAFTRGRAHGLSLHREPYWDSLRDYAPFQELMRPKG
jgi:tetratricopeptide (TPR) repeat protein